MSRSALFVASAAFLSMLFCIPASSQAKGDGETGGISSEKLLELVNADRTKAGLKALKADKRIDEAAALHLGSFVEKGEISDQYDGEPTLLERLRMAQVPCGKAGEVQLKAANVEQLSKFLNRADIQPVLLNPSYTAAGFAEVQNGNQEFIVANFVQPLESLSPDEVEKLVVDSVQLLRSRQKLPAFKVTRLPKLRGLACDMKQTDSLKVKPINPYGGSLSAPTKNIRNFMYTTFDPGTLPATVEVAGDDPKIDNLSVGVCFGPSKTYPAGTYWVAIMLYGSSNVNHYFQGER